MTTVLKTGLLLLFTIASIAIKAQKGTTSQQVASGAPPAKIMIIELLQHSSYRNQLAEVQICGIPSNCLRHKNSYYWEMEDIAGGKLLCISDKPPGDFPICVVGKLESVKIAHQNTFVFNVRYFSTARKTKKLYKG